MENLKPLNWVARRTPDSYGALTPFGDYYLWYEEEHWNLSYHNFDDPMDESEQAFETIEEAKELVEFLNGIIK